MTLPHVPDAAPSRSSLPRPRRRSLDDLVSDAAEVTRHLAEVPPPRRTLTIPDRAVGVVAGLDTYGD